MQPGSRSNKPLISEDIPITNWHDSAADCKVFRAALPAAPCLTVLKHNKKPYEPPKERSSQLASPCHLSTRDALLLLWAHVWVSKVLHSPRCRCHPQASPPGSKRLHAQCRNSCRKSGVDGKLFSTRSGACNHYK